MTATPQPPLERVPYWVEFSCYFDELPAEVGVLFEKENESHHTAFFEGLRAVAAGYASLPSIRLADEQMTPLMDQLVGRLRRATVGAHRQVVVNALAGALEAELALQSAVAKYQQEHPGGMKEGLFHCDYGCADGPSCPHCNCDVCRETRGTLRPQGIR